MTSSLANRVSTGSASPLDHAATSFRQDINSRLMRLLPVLFVALLSLTLLQGSSRLSWSTAMQAVACLVMILAYSFRRRLSIPKSAVVFVACLYLWGISAASMLGWMPSSALGTALALVVLQIVLGCRHRYLGTLASVASYVGVGALAYVYFKDTSADWPLPSAATALPILPWILLSVSFACFAFIVLVEAEKMLQKIVAAQQFDTAAGDGSGIHATKLEIEMHRLRAVNRNLEMITYALSHDLRAPLRSIEGFSRSLLDTMGNSAPESTQRDVREIRAGVDRMQRMVTQWLSFISGDQSALHCEQIDLSKLAREVAAELRNANPERKAAIHIEPELTIHGDALLIRELLQNLMGNAWKFTRHNDADAVIEVGSYVNSFQTNYFVRDNGAGFAAADAPKLFMPFVRLHSGQQYEGSGIGLAIARKIVDNHGGRIWAEGQANLGATFSFAFPTPAGNAPSSTTTDTPESSSSVFDMRCVANRQ